VGRLFAYLEVVQACRRRRTTVVATLRAGRRAIGIEREASYFEGRQDPVTAVQASLSGTPRTEPGVGKAGLPPICVVPASRATVCFIWKLLATAPGLVHSNP
jgi:hypothetical protein